MEGTDRPAGHRFLPHELPLRAGPRHRSPAGDRPGEPHLNHRGPQPLAGVLLQLHP
ncbi:hypothetical protein ACFFX0_21075 [Citricoccus parietis]|uniref:Uncharacterized protein n=1 Tax=Citricoccus parietis TaxID=592307 RepID=A0ABV5G3P6_9MICC